jgi:hypothetical protein
MDRPEKMKICVAGHAAYVTGPGLNGASAL